MTRTSLRTGIQKQFEALARRYGPHEIARAGWRSRAEQTIRYDVLLEIGSLEGKTILDVGCGVGDLYGYLLERKWHGCYTGCDLVLANCQEGAKKYGSGLFLHQNVLETNDTQQFDYVLASGIFFLRADDWEEVVCQTLQRMFDLCKIGMGANFLSAYSPSKVTEHLAYADPGFVIDLCASMTPHFQLRHDYTPQGNDFTLFAYRS